MVLVGLLMYLIVFRVVLHYLCRTLYMRVYRTYILMYWVVWLVSCTPFFYILFVINSNFLSEYILSMICGFYLGLSSLRVLDKERNY